ncbi:hypothetical protein OG481_09795 [Streptomyces longwoodensis]|uniref:hypothetical protein n=1 Tax=Streptomyces longwoodensis TaxID=68231 RepID=UPI002DD7C617|nr:hypothetical protein [Streptomyces longwoodensis]WRY88809.1 hypothetical protein OG481_09795 [Streptomyces longwoodensis]
MPRIRMLTSVAGAGFSWRAGDEIDLPGPEATAWADGVRAELVRAEPVETPEQPPAAETAARRPARRRAAPRGTS